MNLFNTQMQLPILLTNIETPIELTNPLGFDYIKQQQSSKELILSDNENYILLTTCLFEAIFNEYSNKLLPRDIIFFVQLLNLYSAALNKKQKTIIYSSEKLAKLLGYKAKDKNNMRSIVLRMVKKLEQLGFLSVTRNKNKKGSDKVNEIVPILPDPLYDKIKYAPSNFNLDNSRLAGESNIQHILRTKLFTPMDLEFIKSLFDDATITATYKLFFLNCIITAYKNYQTTGALSFSATSQELMNKNNISRATLTRILNYIKNQYPNYFIEVGHSYAKSDDIDSNRYDKSTFIIAINPIVIPKSFLNKNNVEVKEEIEQTNTVEVKVEYGDIDNAYLVADNETEKPDTYKVSKAACSKKQPGMLKKAAHNNKDIIIKESNKNIDANIDKNINAQNEELDKLAKNNQIKPQAFLQTSNSEHLESEQSSLSSKSLKNIFKGFMDVLPLPSNATAEDASKTIRDNLSRKNKVESTEKKTASYFKANNLNSVIPKKTASQIKASNDNRNKELRQFYPLSEKDASMLNFKANREFSVNFTNQLLLKLYIKYPEKRFKNKYTFSDYMVKALKKEHHQGPLVNHTTFRFSCNISAKEQNILEAEKYLTDIENSHDTSYEMQVKKKIAGLFKNVKAYEIVLNSDFSYVDGVFKLTFRKKVELTKVQQALLQNAIKSVYGNRVNIEITIATNNKPNKQFAEKPRVVVCDEAKPLSLKLSNTAWHGIRRDLIEEFGQAIDNSWFARAVATEEQETSTLRLTMPSKFMSDFIKSRYGYAISRIARAFGFKYIEYNY